MERTIKLIKDYFSLLENFNTNRKAFESVLHPEIEQIEYPNTLTKTSTCRGFDSLLRGLETGKSLLSWQRFDVQRFHKMENRVITELHWTAELNTGIGNFRKGHVIKAYICMILELKDGLIFRQRNYDCYENW
jgi:hypothetical protein